MEQTMERTMGRTMEANDGGRALPSSLARGCKVCQDKCFAVDVVAFQAATLPLAYPQAASLRAVTWACEWWPFRPLAAQNLIETKI